MEFDGGRYSKLCISSRSGPYTLPLFIFPPIFILILMQANTEEKQKYLREEIFPTYDPEEFVQFLKADLHIQELDVQHLTMNTIQSCVLKFKQYKFYQKEQNRESSTSSNQQRPKKIQYQKNGSISTLYDYQFEEKIKCLQVEPFAKNLQIYVPKTEVVQKEGVFLGLGSKTQVWFVLKTNMNKQAVRRLQEDFEWLSSTITKLYPLLAMPELIPPSKDWEENHQKRRKELQEYIQMLASRQDMRRSNLLFQFLTFPPQKMDKVRRNYDSMSAVKALHSVKTESGNIQLSLTNKLRSYVQSTLQYMRRAPKIHEGISESMEKVMGLLEDTSKQIYKIVDYFAELHQNYNEVTNKTPQFKVNEYSESLININNFFHSFANDLVNRSKTIGSNLRQFSKIAINYDKSIYRLYKGVQDAEKDYLSFKASLNRKKEKIYPEVGKWEVDQKQLQNRRINKQQAFELMLPKQTSIQNEQRRWLAYLYSNYKNQFKTYLGFEVKRYFQVYCTFCSQLLLNNKNYIEELTRFIDQSNKLPIP